MHRIAIIFIISLLIAGCSRSSRNPDLLRADALTATDPREALRLLDSLPSAGLSETDRHFRDLLSVKAADKAYIAHTSDSLILDAAAWFKGTDRYAEALYYAGRVYSDLGDYPTALRYFQNALDSLPEDTPQADLRNCVLSQTGRLLNHLNMHQEAIPYLENSLLLSLKRNDSINLPYDYLSLGSVYIDLKKYTVARQYFNKAVHSAKEMPDSEIAYIQGFAAVAAYHEGRIDSARRIISDIITRVPVMSRDFFKAYAADIYYTAGVYDSVRIYASDIIKSDYSSYRITGYNYLLKPELRKYIADDSVKDYFDRYLETLESNHRLHDADAAIVQNSFYNYSLHEREKTKLIASRTNRTIWLLVATIIILILILIIIYYRRSIVNKKIKLEDALATIRELNDRLEQLELQQCTQGQESGSFPRPEESELTKNTDQQKREDHTEFTESNRILFEDNNAATQRDEAKTLAEIRFKVNEEISLLRERASRLDPNLDRCRDTEIYQILKHRAKQNDFLKNQDPLWNDIFEAISVQASDFKNKIERLSGQKLSDSEYRYAVLVRLGLSTLQIGVLYCKSKGAIAYQRRHLCLKLFRGGIPSNEFSKVLRML